jgi:membrane protease YdiL (CAAX protease family)
MMLVMAAVIVPVDALEIPWLESFLWQVLALPLLVGAARLLARFVDRRSFAEYGLRRRGGSVLAGVALGAGLATVWFGVALVGGQVAIEGGPHTRYGVPWLVSLAGFGARYAAVAVFEELFHRGFLIVNLGEGLRGLAGERARALAWIGSSALFGLLHLTNDGATVVAGVNVALLGLLFGFPFVRSGSLRTSIGLHFGWNSALGNVWGLPVSGFEARTALLRTAIEESAWTGGASGPGGGLLATVILAAGLAVAARLTRPPRTERSEPPSAGDDYFLRTISFATLSPPADSR